MLQHVSSKDFVVSLCALHIAKKLTSQQDEATRYIAARQQTNRKWKQAQNCWTTSQMSLFGCYRL